MRTEEGSGVYTLRLINEQIRHSVMYPLQDISLVREEEDYGRYVAYSLSGWVARLPERGVLKVRKPLRWIDYIKRGFILRWPWMAGYIHVEWNVVRYEATHYLPAVKIPKDMRKNEFKIWWDGYEGATHFGEECG